MCFLCEYPDAAVKSVPFQEVFAFVRVQLQGKQSTFSLSGMKTKLFGGDTPEQREQKIKLLDEQIHEAEDQVQEATKEAQWVLILIQ